MYVKNDIQVLKILKCTFDEGSGIAIKVVSLYPRKLDPVILLKRNVLDIKLIFTSLDF